jgi:hypothetical protein
MTDRPIIFSAPMVKALLAGRKTQTRRLAWRYRKEGEYEGRDVLTVQPTPWQWAKPGDRLWVRENLKWSEFRQWWLYAADDKPVELNDDDPRVPAMVAWAHHREQDYCPSIHMPRWASRVTLTVTDVRRHPLNDITDDDAQAEGIVRFVSGAMGGGFLGWHVPGVEHPAKVFRPIFCRPTPREMFAALWDTLHGSGEWLANPEVVALTFSVALCNIDAQQVAA